MVHVVYKSEYSLLKVYTCKPMREQINGEEKGKLEYCTVKLMMKNAATPCLQINAWVSEVNRNGRNKTKKTHTNKMQPLPQIRVLFENYFFNYSNKT